jgi:hypothetical protein
MPTIATRGGASARGFGFSGIKTNVTSQTFTSSTTWVAPVGVTSLIAVIGKGQDGGGTYVSNLEVCFSSVSNSASGSGANSLPVSGNGLANDAKIFVNFSTALDGTFFYVSQSGATFATDRNFTFYANNTFSFTSSQPYGFGSFPYIVVPGTWAVANTGAYPLNNNYGYGSSPSYYAQGLAYFPGGGGANTTGFGFTFPGGGVSGDYPNQVGQEATPASYTNVAVTPGASYSLSIPASGYITIQYLS